MKGPNAVGNFVRSAHIGENQAHSGTVGRRPRTKPENEFLDPPVFMVLVLGLLFFVGMGRGADLEDFGEEDGPSERRF